MFEGRICAPIESNRFVWTFKKGFIKRFFESSSVRVNENLRQSIYSFVAYGGSFTAKNLVLPRWFIVWLNGSNAKLMELRLSSDRWCSLLCHPQSTSSSAVYRFTHSHTVSIEYERNYRNTNLSKFISFNFNENNSFAPNA